MLKVYGLYGRTTALIRIPVGNYGKAFLEVEFSRGRMGAGPANRPATFATADPIRQGIIENSPYFGPQIKLIRTYGEPSAPAPAQPKAAPAEAPVSVTEIPGVESYEEAVEYLKAHGAKAINLKDADAVKKYAKKIGVIFPNASF